MLISIGTVSEWLAILVTTMQALDMQHNKGITTELL